MKQCSKCRQSKPASEFNRNKAKPDFLQSRCRKCQNEGDRHLYGNSKGRRDKVRARKDRNSRINREYVRNYLATHPCADCGEDDPIVLDFDHVKGQKRIES